jgi:hypothetical protein
VKSDVAALEHTARNFVGDFARIVHPLRHSTAVEKNFFLAQSELLGISRVWYCGQRRCDIGSARGSVSLARGL